MIQQVFERFAIVITQIRNEEPAGDVSSKGRWVSRRQPSRPIVLRVGGARGKASQVSGVEQGAGGWSKETAAKRHCTSPIGTLSAGVPDVARDA